MIRSAMPRKSATRASEAAQPDIDRFRGQHLNLAQQQIVTEHGPVKVTIDEAESPLAWLARQRAGAAATAGP